MAPIILQSIRTSKGAAVYDTGDGPQMSGHTQQPKQTASAQDNRKGFHKANHPTAIATTETIWMWGQLTGVSTANLEYGRLFNRRTFSKQLLPSGKKCSCCNSGVWFRMKTLSPASEGNKKNIPHWGRRTGASQHFRKMQDESPVEISVWAPISQIDSVQPGAHKGAAFQTQEEMWKAWKLTTTKTDKDDSSVAEPWQRNLGGNSRASKPASCSNNNVHTLQEPDDKMGYF